jgi:hypothetical protein
MKDQNLNGADGMALAMRGGAVGANLGFRRNWQLCSQEELAAIRQGEEAVARLARIQNGMEPDHRNGFGPGHLRSQCRPVRHGDWEARKARVLARAQAELKDRREAQREMRAVV